MTGMRRRLMDMRCHVNRGLHLQITGTHLTNQLQLRNIFFLY